MQSDVTDGFDKVFIKNRQYYSDFIRTNLTTEFVIYADNILEGMTVLNSIVKSATDCQLKMVILEPIDQPIYVFEYPNSQYVSIVICGSYSNWILPEKVHDLVALLDLPDFVIYKLNSDEVIFAGELTETGSVGNSQWQREGRKVAAARLGIPFVYKTVYSEFDESQKTVREPTSLLVYASILYSLRYKANSFVLFEEPNRISARARRRVDGDSKRVTLGQLISAVLLQTLVPSSRSNLELVYSTVYESMLQYLAEPKLGIKAGTEPRIVIDFPQLSDSAICKLTGRDTEFIHDLAALHLSLSRRREETVEKHRDLLELEKPLHKWTLHARKNNIARLSDEADKLGLPFQAPKGQFKVGITKTELLVGILTKLKVSMDESKISELLKHDESIVFPLRLHKSETQWSPDPETGEIVSFGELFTLNLKGNKIRNFIGVVTVEPPSGFNIQTKKDSKLYKALRLYSDLILLPNNELISTPLPPSVNETVERIESLEQIINKDETEEIALVSSMLALTKVLSDFDLRYIAINHGSWQQIELQDQNAELQVLKINRDDSKLDLVLQDGTEAFILAEGKKNFKDIFRTREEVKKIKAAMTSISNLIETKSQKNLLRIPCFIFNVDIPEVNGADFLNAEVELLRNPEFTKTLNEIASGPYFLLGVYRRNQSTRFLPVFSNDFPEDYKAKLEDVFGDFI
jgi:hypothetical protein